MGDASGDRSETHLTRPDDVAQLLADVLIDRIDRIDLSRPPLLVAIDGRSGAGKSTLARALGRVLATRGLTVTIIEGDDFYAGGTAERWDRRSPAENARHVIDWRRQRRVLEDLRTTGHASWHPFDWDAPDWDGEPVPLRTTPSTATAADIVILEGAYSARPELHGLLDLRVLVDTPAERRRRQLHEHDSDDHRPDWDARWSAAEDHYFAAVMPSDRFDHVL